MNRSTGIGDLGSVKWSLALCLLLMMMIIYFSLWRGIKQSGKVSNKNVSNVILMAKITIFDQLKTIGVLTQIGFVHACFNMHQNLILYIFTFTTENTVKNIYVYLA